MTPFPKRVRPLMCIPIGPGVHVRTHGPRTARAASRAVITINRRTVIHSPGRAVVFTHGLGSVKVRL